MNLLVLAHPRSGHHAFIDWFCSHQSEPYIHVNDPAIDLPTLTPTGGGHRYNGMERTINTLPIQISEPNLVVNFERPDCREEFLDMPQIIFIRDFKNFLSSVVRLSIDLNDPELPELSVPAWDWCADKALDGSPFILFDGWVSDENYRNSIAKFVGIQTDGKPWQRVSPFGGTEERPGSSFDSLRFDGKASLMSVTYRDESQSEIYQKYATKERLEKNELIKQ
jgi:hypothetical protein